MRFLHVINGWTMGPALWRYLLWPPLRIQRCPALYETEDGELAILEAPAVYSIQILGVALFVELNRGMSA